MINSSFEQKYFWVFMKCLLLKYNCCFLSVLHEDDMDSLKLEMSGSLKELHCPYEKLVSGILNGGELKPKDHLKFICMFSVNLLLSTSLCRQKCILKHPLFCLL